MSTNFNQNLSSTEIRYYTAFDPYHLSVDNRPLTDIGANLNSLHTSVSTLRSFATKKWIPATQLYAANSATSYNSLAVPSSPTPIRSHPVRSLMVNATTTSQRVGAFLLGDQGWDINKPVTVTVFVKPSVGSANFTFAWNYSLIDNGNTASTSSTGISTTLTATTQYRQVVIANQIPAGTFTDARMLIDIGVNISSSTAEAIEIFGIALTQ